MVEKQGRFGRKNGKGFYDYPEKGKGQKSLWSELSGLQPKHLDPDTLDVEELKQRFLVVQAVGAARTVGGHVITDPREADVGSIPGFRSVERRGGEECRTRGGPDHLKKKKKRTGGDGLMAEKHSTFEPLLCWGCEKSVWPKQFAQLFLKLRNSVGWLGDDSACYTNISKY